MAKIFYGFLESSCIFLTGDVGTDLNISECFKMSDIRTYRKI